ILDAFEALVGEPDAPVFLTCEHASERLPEGYAWHPDDERLVGTHWAYDLGARDLVFELADAMRTPAVLSRFSRLFVDPNRPEGSDTLFRAEAEGAPVALNRDIDEAERARRIEHFYRPYHDAIDRRLAVHGAPVLFSIHTFTPVYDGAVRPMEVGVLFDTQDELAERAATAIRAAGFVTALNEPYSGKAGLIHAAEHHAGNHGRKALELEVRQDLAVRPEFRRRLVVALAGFFGERGR
ncbi:MAG TPA: N-formylglutamate amidohydrolase, partial [Vulgatibacter sp.]